MEHPPLPRLRQTGKCAAFAASCKRVWS
jgi:hypothetical protein